MDPPKKNEYFWWYVAGFIVLIVIILTIMYFSLNGNTSTNSSSGSEGENSYTSSGSSSSTTTDPENLRITKVTNKIVTFSNVLKFDVVKSRTELNMFLSYGFAGSTSLIAQKRGIKIPSEGDPTKDLDVTTFTRVDGSGAKFSGLTEGIRYYIQFIFTSSDPLIEDKGYTYEFVAPNRIQFGSGTTIQLPIDGSKGQLTWTWVVKDKRMIAKYRRASSTIPWFGGDAVFEDDIVSLVPSSATYMLVKTGELYYRMSDKKLVDVFDNETETTGDDDISSSSVTTYST